MSSLLKNIIILGGIALVGAVGYYLIVLEGSNELQNSGSLESELAARETQLFLQQLQTLRSTTLDTSVLRDPRFTSFIDYTDPVAPLASGRPNPFE